MNEEKTLQQAVDIKINKTSFTNEEQQIINLSDSLLAKRIGVARNLESKVAELSDKILRDVDHPQNWQPSDYLPDFADEWELDINTIQEQSKALPDELLVVLVGDMITEEGLPTYQSLLNRISPIRDITGNQDTAWGKWTRWWTAEENRHGELLHTHLMFIPRMNMRNIERDIQNLIGSGFDPGVGEDPYKLMVYTSFQEKATHISHLGTANIAKTLGDERLYTICSMIAKDETRHFSFYKEVMNEMFNIDPNGAMTSYAHMMKKTIPMPASEMNSSRNPTLYTDFSEVAQATGVYSTEEYAGIIDLLNAEWKIKDRKVTTDDAKKAQEYLLKLSGRYLEIVERRKKIKFRFDASKFDWIK